MDDFTANRIAGLLGTGRGLITCETTHGVGISVRVHGRPELTNLGAAFALDDWAGATKLASSIAAIHQLPLILWFPRVDEL